MVGIDINTTVTAIAWTTGGDAGNGDGTSSGSFRVRGELGHQPRRDRHPCGHAGNYNRGWRGVESCYYGDGDR